MCKFTGVLQKINEYKILVLSIAIVFSSLILSSAVFFHRSYPRYVPSPNFYFIDTDSGDIVIYYDGKLRTLANIRQMQGNQ